MPIPFLKRQNVYQHDKISAKSYTNKPVLSDLTELVSNFSHSCTTFTVFAIPTIYTVIDLILFFKSTHLLKGTF